MIAALTLGLILLTATPASATMLPKAIATGNDNLVTVRLNSGADV